MDLQSHPGQTWWQHPAPLPFLPGVEEKALPGVPAQRFPSWGEEVVENRACTGLTIEGVILKSSKIHLLTPKGHAADVTQLWVELLGRTAASCQERTLGGEVWRVFGSLKTFCCL